MATLLVQRSTAFCIFFNLPGKISLVWYKKKKEGKNTLSKSERRTVLLLASFIPG